MGLYDRSKVAQTCPPHVGRSNGQSRAQTLSKACVTIVPGRVRKGERGVKSKYSDNLKWRQGDIPMHSVILSDQKYMGS